VLAVTVTVAEPALAGKAKGLENHGSKAVGGGRDEPPGLVGNVHAKAKGHAKTAQAPAAGPPQAEPKKEGHKTRSPVRGPKAAKTGSSGGSGAEAHHHVIVCHRTGSASNPYVVLNIPWTAWSEAHGPGSSHAHPPLDGRTDILLRDPASRPGSKDGFTKADCLASDPVSPPRPAPPPPPPPTPPAPSADEPDRALGEDPGSPGSGQLPFTGFPLLFALLAALGAAVSAAGIARGAREQRQGLERRPCEPSHLSDVGNVSGEEALDGAPDDARARESEGQAWKPVEGSLDAPRGPEVGR
jgi:hypothetical protein